MTGCALVVDLIEELRLRRWARENFVAAPFRDAAWHPIVHDEMDCRDREEDLDAEEYGRNIVPLVRGPAGRPHAPGSHRLGTVSGDAREMHYT